MEDKKRVIIDLDFDVSDFTKAAAELNGKIAELNKNQRELKKAGQEGSIEFQKNTEALRENKKELAETNKTIQNLTIANKANAGSNEQLKAQLSLLTAEYNSLSKEQRTGTERGKELQKQTKAISDELKGNEEAVGDNRRSVGDYAKALSGTPFGAFISGIKATGAAFLANPMTLVISGIVGAFALLKKAFTSSEEGSNKLNKVMGALGASLSGVLKVIEPVANFIFDVVIAAFEELGKVAESAMQLVAAGLDALGFDDAAQGVKNFVSGSKDLLDTSQNLADAEAELVRVRREQRVIQLEAQNAAEKQRQLRDDESKSIEERQQANEELGRILEEQSEKELAIARKAMEVALLRQKVDGDTTEVLDEIAAAKLDLIDIEERITGQQSEQLANVNSLNKEAKQQAKDAVEAAKQRQKESIDLNKQQLELLIAQSGTNKKTLQEELDLAEKVSAEKLSILEKEFKAKLINETQFNIQKIAIENELLKAQTQIAIDNAQRELKSITDLNQSKIENGQFLNDTLFQQELERQNNILQAQKDFEAKKLEQGIISQTEFNDNIALIDEQAAIKKSELEAEKKAAEEETRIVDLENKLEIELQEAENEFARRQIELDRQKNQELAQAESIGADKALIETKFANFSKELAKQKEEAQLNEAVATFDAIGSLMQDNAAASKAMAVATSLINSYQGITAVLSAGSTIPEPFGSIAKAIQATAIGAMGFKNVQKIATTQVPKAAKGGIFGGQSHSNGGTKGYFSDGTQIEVEKGELFAVVNKRNTSMLNSLNALNTFGGNGKPFFAKGGVMKFADGGVALNSLSGGVEQNQRQVTNLIDAIKEIPNPVVAVQDINEVQADNRRTEVRAIL